MGTKKYTSAKSLSEEIAKRKKANQSGGTTNTTQKRRYTNAKELSDIISKGKIINSFDFDSFGTDLENTNKLLSSIYSGWQNQETMKTALPKIQKMYGRINQYQSIRGDIGQNTDLSELQSIYKDVIDNWDTRTQVYGNYKNADAYNAASKLSMMDSKYSGLTYDQAQAKKNEFSPNSFEYKYFDNYTKYDDLKEFDKAIEGKNTGKKINIPKDANINVSLFPQSQTKKSTSLEESLKSNLNTNSGMFRNPTTNPLTKNEYYENLVINNRDLEAERNKWSIEHKADLYSDLTQNSDFNEKSKFVSTKGVFDNSADKFTNGQFGLGYGDIVYEYINADEKTRNEIKKGTPTIVRGGVGVKSIESSSAIHENNYDEFYPEEIKLYNYLYDEDKKKGTNRATKFLEDMQMTLDARAYKKQTAEWKLANQSAGGIAINSLLSVPASVYGAGLTAMDSLSDAIRGQEYNPFSKAKMYTNYAQDTREYAGEYIKENTDFEIFGQNVPSFLYQTGMSMADNLLGAKTTGVAYLPLMGTNAFHQKAKELIEEGEDAETVYSAALASGLAEMVFEKISLDRFLKIKDVDGVRAILKTAAKQAGIEASEEFFTELSNILTDTDIRGESSELMKKYNDMISRGYTKEEADAEIAKQVGSQIFWATTGGALSGGGMGLVGATGNYITNIKTGKGIKENERTKDMIDVASNLTPEQYSAYETYSRYAKKGVNAQNITDAQLGNLYNTTDADTVGIIKSKKTTSEQKLNAFVTRSKLERISEENKAVKEAKANHTIGEETKVTETGREVNVAELKAKDGKIVLPTENGDTSIDDITFKLNDAIIVDYATAIAETDGTDMANLFLSQYDGKTDADKYANEFNLVVDYSKGDFTFREIMNNKGSLSGEAVGKIYEQTRLSVIKAEQERINKLNQAMADKKFYKGNIEDSAITDEVWNGLNNRQKQAITFIKGFAQATGMNLVLTHNPDSKIGGSYEVDGNTITIDVAKFEHLKGNLIETIIPTMSHEVTHWMKEKTPELWNSLNEIVFNTLVDHYNSEQGLSDRAKILSQSMGRKISIEEAKSRTVTEDDIIRAEMRRKGNNDIVSREEIIARACEDMLSMSNEGRRIFNSLSETEQKTLKEKIAGIIQDLLNWVDEMLNSYKSKSREAEIMRQYKNKLQEQLKLWDEMIVQSVETNQSLEKSGAYNHETTSNNKTFQMRGIVEQSGDLIAVHNLNAEQLADVVNRGQFLMPSIAVTNKGHTAFGDISVVFGAETINPYLDEKNKLFGADAWTPTQTRLKKNPVFNNDEVSNTLKDVKRTIGSGFSQVFDMSKSEFKETVTNADGSLYDALAHDMGMQTAYALKNKLITKVPKTADGRIDKSALKEQLDAKLDNDNVWRNYKRWLGEISDKVITSYDAASNEDILNNMKAQPDTAKTFRLGENGELTVPAKEYNSLDEYQENKHRLSEDADVMTKEVGNNLVNWAKDVSSRTDASVRSVVNAINSSFGNRYSASDIVSNFEENGINITRADAKALQTLYKDAVELPTQYFEAKPQRAVGLEEIKLVVLPDNTNAEVKNMLEENNIPYKEYIDNNKESRLDVLNSVQNVRFSERSTTNNETEITSIGSHDLSNVSKAVDASGKTLFQYRAMVEDEDIYREMLLKHKDTIGITEAQIEDLFNVIDKAVDIISENLEVLDYAWDADINDRAFSPVKPNSDSLYKVSLDFSTLCRKRLLQQTIQATLQDALNKNLSKEETIAIRDELIKVQEEGRQIEVACALCYVESARMKSPKQINKFLNNRESIIKEFFASRSGGSIKEKIAKAELKARKELQKANPNGMKGKNDADIDALTSPLNQMTKADAEFIRDAKRKAKASYKLTEHEQAELNTAMDMSVTDFTSAKGLENLAKQHRDLFDAYTSFVRNATHSKGIENDTWWRAGDSESIGDTLIANMNEENGLRSQSWSDFQVIHLLDYIAATIELSTKGAKRQSYTKVPDYVKLLGNTGDMINISLIPERAFNGKLEYDATEGMAYEIAKQLRDEYHETVGTICIGIENEQIKMLLADDTIDMVIPYHHSGMSQAVRKLMHIPSWKTYQASQGESKLSDDDAKARAKEYGVKLKRDNNYQKPPKFSEWFNLQEAQQIAKLENANPSDMRAYKKYGKMYGGYMAMQNAANNYLKLCAERGLAPKFSSADSDFTQEANYWKLLIDRKMVDNVTGEIIEQKAIKPIFNEQSILEILNDELERYPQVKTDQEYAQRKVVEKFLSGNMKVDQSTLDAIQKPIDNISNVNILESSRSGVLNSERITAQEDAEYLEAAKRGDMETAQRMVEEAAKRGGFPTKVYHGTERFGFTKPRTKGVERGMDWSPFFATESLELAQTYSGAVGERAIKGQTVNRSAYQQDYETAVNSFVNKVNEIAGKELIKASDIPYDKYTNKIKKGKITPGEIALETDGFIESVIETIQKEKQLTDEQQIEISDFADEILLAQTKAFSPSGNYGLYANTDGMFVIDGSGAVWNAIPFNKIPSQTTANTREIAQWARENGYSGVLFKNIYDQGGLGNKQESPVNVYTFFNPQSQVKSADPVTYNAFGKVIPLSKRFNAKNKDIRYSDRDNNMDLEKENRILKMQVGRYKNLYEDYDARAERKTVIQSFLSTTMALNKKLTTNSKDVHIPDSLKPVVIEFINAIDFSSKQLLGKTKTPTRTDIATEKALNKVHSMVSEKSSTITLKKAIQSALEMFENAEKILNVASDGLVDSSLVALDVDMIADIKDMIKDLDILIEHGEKTFVLQKMSLDHLKTLNKMAKSINHWANVADKALANKHKKRISDLAWQSIDETDKYGNRQEYIGAIEGVKNFLNWSNLLPVNAFKRLGNAAMEFFDGLRDSQDKVTFNRQKVIDFTDELFKKYKKYKPKNWRTEVKTFDIKLPGAKTKTTVRMPISYIMSLYCVAKQEHAQRHLYGRDASGNKLTYTDEKGIVHDGGGMTIKGFKDSKLSLKVNKVLDNTIVDDSIVKQITSVLTKEQREVADALQKYMNDKGSEWGNAVSMALYGITKFDVENYFPITVSPHTLNSDKIRDDKASFFSILNYGFTKERNPNANQSIEISDIFDVFANHMNMVSIYNAYALSIFDIARWYNFKGKTDGKEISVTKSIETAFGSGAVSYVNNLIKDLNGQHESSRLGFISKIFKNTKVAMVGNSLSVALLQPTAYLKAMVKISPRYLLKSLLHVRDFGAQKGVEKSKKYCGIALLKSQGYFETGVSANTTKKMIHDESFGEKVTEWSLKGAEFMDERTWGLLWNACEFEVRAKRKDLNVKSEEFYKVVADKLRDVIYETQVVDSPLTKSDLMRSGDTGAKMITMFASEMTVAYNMAYESAYQTHLDAKKMGKKEAIKKNAKNLSMTLMAYTLTSVANALATGLVEAFRYGGGDDEEENKFLKNFLADWLIIGKIPYFKESISMAQGFSSSRSDTLWLQSAFKAYEYWSKVLDGKDDKTMKALDETLKFLSYVSGYAIYNQWRDLRALLRLIGLYEE